MRTLSFALILCSACAGSTSSTDDGTDDGDVVATPDNVAELFVEAWCEVIQRCQDTLGRLFPDQETCEAAVAAFIGASSRLDPMFFVGRYPELADFDSVAVEACLEAVRGTACTSSLDLDPAVCAGAIVGNQPQGTCCDDRDACAPALQCVRAGVPAGTCEPAAGDGDSCTGRACADGLYCSFPAGTCAAEVSAGEPCDYDDACAAGFYCDSAIGCTAGATVPGAPCDRSAMCAPAMFCDLVLGQCSEIGQLNDACDRGEGCAPELHCLNHRCRDTQHLAVGEECDPASSNDCPPQIPFEGVCADDGTGTYRCATSQDIGEACDPGGDDAICAVFAGAWCDEATSTCAALPTQGQPCTLLCAPILAQYCATTAPGVGTCAARLGIGGACDPSNTGDFSVLVSACHADLACDPATSQCAPMAYDCP